MMLFDYCISNPAFNIAQSKNIAGTGGNTTLYKTATNHAFNKLKAGGVLMNVTLKGIITPLLNGKYKEYQTQYINLMDNIKVWDYNTCFFILEKNLKTQPVQIDGGLAKKIYTPYKEQSFPFVYYSGSNNGMNKFFNGTNKVIRKLPGATSDTVTYDYTDKVISAGPKFAFYVMESKKSYIVTDEPIYGGTICYIPTETIEQAEKLKLFTLHNKVFKRYIEQINFRGHAFGLRNIKKFDINQIVTGNEMPVEWNINEEDLKDPIVLENDVIVNLQKVKDTGEVFTPTLLVDYMFYYLELYYPNAFKSNKTFCDTMCGTGQFLDNILQRKLESGINFEEALQSIYGVDISETNIDECKYRLLGNRKDLKHIVDANIVCHDTFTYNYNFNR